MVRRSADLPPPILPDFVDVHGTVLNTGRVSSIEDRSKRRRIRADRALSIFPLPPVCQLFDIHL